MISKNPNYITARSHTNQTLLHIPAILGDITMIDYLIDAGVPVDERDSAGQSPLWYLLDTGSHSTHIEGMALKLIAQGADPLIRNNRGQSLTDIISDYSKQFFPYRYNFTQKIMKEAQQRKDDKDKKARN